MENEQARKQTWSQTNAQRAKRVFFVTSPLVGEL